MWLARGVQSVIFYYASCTPCAAAEDLRRRKREAIRVQREQAKSAMIVSDQPRPFHQPTPFSTNSGWMEEIALGPGPPPRRHRTRNCQNDGTGLPTLSSTSSMTVEDSTLSVTGGGGNLSSEKKLHWSRLQREDEALWGEEREQNFGNPSTQKSAADTSARGRTATSHSNKYYIARAPPVNDLHPPIVSGPSSRAEIQWILQPLPSSKVMAGKARHEESGTPKRNRSDIKLKESNKEEEPVQEGQLTHITDRPNWLMDKTNSYRRTFDSFKKHRPTSLDNNISLPAPSSSPEKGKKRNEDHTGSLRQAPLTATTIETPRSTSMDNVRAYDEWHLQISPSFHSQSNSLSSMESLADSLQWPKTPYSRPESKRAEVSDKVFHPSYLNFAASPHREQNKTIEAIHLEMSESKPTEHVHPLKWRWSFDI